MTDQHLVGQGAGSAGAARNEEWVQIREAKEVKNRTRRRLATGGRVWRLTQDPVFSARVIALARALTHRVEEDRGCEWMDGDNDSGANGTAMELRCIRIARELPLGAGRGGATNATRKFRWPVEKEYVP